MLKKIRGYIQKISFLREFVAFNLAPSGLFDKYLLNSKLNHYWQRRLKEAVECPDNQHIERVKQAGSVSGGQQLMHNGLKIYLGSYYGPEVSQILKANGGVHEPQEERIFGEVLQMMPEGGLMIEMGAFWSFYSMWFNSVVKNGVNHMIEPEIFNLKCGQRNFNLNNLKGVFTQAFIGQLSDNNSEVPTICIDDYVVKHDIKHINLLHSDIQGFEHQMLQGSKRVLSEGRVDVIFISTHSDKVHQECLDLLKIHDFAIRSDIGLEDTFSEDGLIVAHRAGYLWPLDIELSKKSQLK